ncbi:MAG TPA: hypothetical protein VHB77_16110 [Planctomycetaceae bacterium]|nr:hypothetical protein [Planctomycetaceae bacterium]
MHLLASALLLFAPQAAGDEPTPLELVKAAISREGFPAESYPVLPALSTPMRGLICNEIAESRAVRNAFAKLDVARRRNVDWFEGVKELETEKAVWALQACLCHPSDDVQIHALRSLERLHDARAVPFLMVYAEYMAVHVEGSENATIHGVIMESTARTLSKLTGEEVVVKGQDVRRLREGIHRWRIWLARQDV